MRCRFATVGYILTSDFLYNFLKTGLFSDIWRKTTHCNDLALFLQKEVLGKKHKVTSTGKPVAT